MKGMEGLNQDTPKEPSLWEEYLKTPAGRASSGRAINEITDILNGRETSQEYVLQNMQQYADIGSMFQLDFSKSGDLRKDAESILKSLPGQEEALGRLSEGEDPKLILSEYRDIAQKIIDSGDLKHTYSALAIKMHIDKLLSDKET